MKSYVLEFFHVGFCHKIGQGHQLNDLVSTVVPDAKCKVLWPLVNSGPGEEVLKIFTIYGRGGHIGHVTWTV